MSVALAAPGSRSSSSSAQTQASPHSLSHLRVSVLLGRATTSCVQASACNLSQLAVSVLLGRERETERECSRATGAPCARVYRVPSRWPCLRPRCGSVTASPMSGASGATRPAVRRPAVLHPRRLPCSNSCGHACLSGLLRLAPVFALTLDARCRQRVVLLHDANVQRPADTRAHAPLAAGDAMESHRMRLMRTTWRPWP